ncbi:MAG: hypothetical protein D3909_07655 [Candidatus Electrothrix sp. ATG1]|nr:hypothetical protein [Candidatus Electrothrix sp. ATG1]
MVHIQQLIVIEIMFILQQLLVRLQSVPLFLDMFFITAGIMVIIGCILPPMSIEFLLYVLC